MQLTLRDIWALKQQQQQPSDCVLLQVLWCSIIHTLNSNQQAHWSVHWKHRTGNIWSDCGTVLARGDPRVHFCLFLVLSGWMSNRCLLKGKHKSLLMFMMYDTFLFRSLPVWNRAPLASEWLNFETTQKIHLEPLPLIHTYFWGGWFISLLTTVLATHLINYWWSYWFAQQLTVPLCETYQFFMRQYLHKKNMS